MPRTTETDEQLLAAFVGSDRDALAELARRYEAKLLGLAGGLLGWRSDLACDAVQETWVRVIRFAGRFNGTSSFKTWLYRILMNQCHTMQVALPTRERGVASESTAGTTPNPREMIEADERRRVVRENVQALSPDKQAILLLCYHESMTHEEAADILDVPLGTVKSRLHSALSELRDRLSREGKL